jgi:IS605 OrfB family transposase
MLVISLLVTLAVPFFRNRTETAHQTRLAHDAKLLETAIQSFYVANNNNWPKASPVPLTRDQLVTTGGKLLTLSLEDAAATEPYFFERIDSDRYLALQSTRNKIRALKTQTEKRLEITSNPKTVIRLEKKLAEYNRHLLPNNWTGLRNKIKSVVTTEIGRTVNVFIRDIKPSETLVIMEDLSEMNARGAKRTRRGKFELSSWAHGELQRHLEEDITWHGGSAAYVVPEYTSQLCGKCGYLDEGNRQGKIFRCLACGYAADADINAARNIKERFFDTELRESVKKHSWNKDLRRQKVKELLLSRFKQKTA